MRVVSLGCLLTLAVGLASAAQDMEGLDPLLKILVENKVITLDQARAVQAEYVKQKAKEATVLKEDIGNQVSADVKTSSPAVPDALKGLKVGVLSYLSFQNGDRYTGTTNETTAYNDFVIKRGYLDVQKDITPYLAGRFTTDITRASNGDWSVRVKYLYAKFHWADKGAGFASQLYSEVGQVHVPWHDYEESINGFRMQDEMFIERNGIFNSADMGAMIGGNFGGEMSADYKKSVNSAYAGRYGSFQMGFYSGAGYHAADRNQNKPLEARISVRPFPDAVPGLQLTGFGVFGGKGNLSQIPGKELPDWNGWDGMLSYESHYFTATAQYLDFKGNQSGTALNPDGTARRQTGYSFFVRGSFPPNAKWGAIARYDRFDPNPDGVPTLVRDVTKTLIGGVFYNVYQDNKVLLDYQVKQHEDPTIPDDKRVQLTFQLKF